MIGVGAAPAGAPENGDGTSGDRRDSLSVLVRTYNDAATVYLARFRQVSRCYRRVFSSDYELPESEPACDTALGTARR